MRKCSVCNEVKSLDDFYTRTKFKGSKKYVTCACKICEIKRINLNIKKNRIKMVEYKGGSCLVCGYKKCIEALEFHHRNREEKKIRLNSTRSLSKRIKDELDKCDLLCSNCHREIERDLFLKKSGVVLISVTSH